jgi:type 1 glutamine amidotransferase
VSYTRKIILHSPRGLNGRVEELAQEFVASGVAFVGCVGRDCEAVEDLVDWVAIANGSPERNFILTSAHPGESLKQAMVFAQSLTGEYEGEVQVVEV